MNIRNILCLICSLFLTLSVNAQGKNSVKWVRVEGGEFLMGCSSADKDCYPDEAEHKVYVSTFEIAACEVTVEQYMYFCEQTGRQKPKEPPFGWQSQHPIVNVTWQDAADYAQWAGCRLPTEAEWEYAAKGGKQSKGYKYSGSNNPLEVGWCFENSAASTHPVGEKLPNELGIYDMSGNVWEWCSDWYGKYSSGAQANPKGPYDGSYRVVRGGSWDDNAKGCRSSNRTCNSPGYRADYLGLRLSL